MLPLILITLIGGNTKSHRLKHYQRQRWVNLLFSGFDASLVYNDGSNQINSGGFYW